MNNVQDVNQVPISYIKEAQHFPLVCIAVESLHDGVHNVWFDILKNSIRGNVPEHSIHGTSSCDMAKHDETQTCCHNWGVARATACHSEDTV